jgi:hypothetical protein
MITPQTFDATDYSNQLNAYLAKVLADSPPVAPKGQQPPAQGGGALGGVDPVKAYLIGNKLFGGSEAAASALPEFTYQAPQFSLGATGESAAGLSSAAAPGAETTISNFAGSATPYLGAAGTAYGLYNVAKGMQQGGNRAGTIQGGLGGLGAGLGLAMMGLGPAGWLAAGGLAAGAGLPHVSKYLGMQHESTKDYKNRKANELIKAGFRPEDVASNFYDTKADNEMWKRIKGTAMKNPLMIADSQGIKETFGPKYMTEMNEFERFAAAQYAVDQGLVGGKKGIIDITDKDKLRENYRDYVNDEQVQQRYNAFKAWEAENVPKGANAMTYFGYTDLDKQREDQGAFKVDQSKLVSGILKQALEGEALKQQLNNYIAANA